MSLETENCPDSNSVVDDGTGSSIHEEDAVLRVEGSPL